MDNCIICSDINKVLWPFLIIGGFWWTNTLIPVGIHSEVRLLVIATASWMILFYWHDFISMSLASQENEALMSLYKVNELITHTRTTGSWMWLRHMDTLREKWVTAKRRIFPFGQSHRDTPPPHKGANDVSPKPVHILNTRVGLFHIRKYPPCVGGVQISNNCHHSHQMLSTFYTSDVVLHTL